MIVVAIIVLVTLIMTVVIVAIVLAFSIASSLSVSTATTSLSIRRSEAVHEASSKPRIWRITGIARQVRIKILIVDRLLSRKTWDTTITLVIKVLVAGNLSRLLNL